MHLAAWWPVLVALAIATVTDLRSRRIPNWLVYPLMLSGLCVSGWRYGLHGIGQSASGFALGAVLFGALALMGGMGMGDVKLLAGVGAWVGPSQLLVALVLTGIVGGIMALCWAIAGGFVGELFRGTGDLVFGMKRRGLRPHPTLVLDNPRSRKMPYAPAIAIGTLISFFSR